MPFEGAFSPLHILIVAVVALMVLGPEQLPRVARQMGQALRDFQRVKQHLTSELRDVVSEFDATGTATNDPSRSAIPIRPPEADGEEAAQLADTEHDVTSAPAPSPPDEDAH